MANFIFLGFLPDTETDPVKIYNSLQKYFIHDEVLMSNLLASILHYGLKDVRVWIKENKIKTEIPQKIVENFRINLTDYHLVFNVITKIKSINPDYFIQKNLDIKSLAIIINACLSTGNLNKIDLAQFNVVIGFDVLNIKINFNINDDSNLTYKISSKKDMETTLIALFILGKNKEPFNFRYVPNETSS